MPQRHRPYLPEFRIEAVRQFRGSGKPMVEIARWLEVSIETWRVSAGSGYRRTAAP